MGIGTPLQGPHEGQGWVQTTNKLHNLWVQLLMITRYSQADRAQDRLRIRIVVG